MEGFWYVVCGTDVFFRFNSIKNGDYLYTPSGEKAGITFDYPLLAQLIPEEEEQGITFRLFISELADLDRSIISYLFQALKLSSEGMSIYNDDSAFCYS